MNIRPLYDRVIVQPDEQQKTTSSGIILADVAVDRPTTGKIVAVGFGKDNKPLHLKIGDSVLFGKFSGQTFKLDNITYMQMKEEEVIGIIE